MKLTKILEHVMSEIGESTKGYDYQLDWGSEDDILRSDGHNEYSFKDDKGVEYAVDIFNKEGYLSVEFSIPWDNPSDSTHGASNFGDQYKVMGTIVSIIKDIVDNDTEGLIKGVEYDPTFKDSEAGDTWLSVSKGTKKSQEPVNKRDRLYRAYIQKSFPNKKVKFTDRGGTIVASFPKTK